MILSVKYYINYLDNRKRGMRGGGGHCHHFMLAETTVMAYKQTLIQLGTCHLKIESLLTKNIT